MSQYLQKNWNKDLNNKKSLREGFGLTISEAQWKETPVVASNRGGLPDQIIDNETGFLVEPDDIQGCAEKVITILKDKKLAKDMGKKGKNNVKKNFLITRHLDNYLSLLIDVIKQNQNHILY